MAIGLSTTNCFMSNRSLISFSATIGKVFIKNLKQEDR